MAGWFYFCAFCVLYIGIFVVNKFVLSVLKFTYPTLFQGWQTLVGFLVLYIGRSLKRTEVGFISRDSLLSWLHGAFFFIVSIYSGSVALSKLSLPAFIVIRNSVDVFVYFFQCARTQRLGRGAVILSALMVVMAAWATALTDPEVSGYTHRWMLVHIVSSVFLILSQKYFKPPSQSDMDILYLNYFCSMIVFAPGSIILGDAVNSFSFSHWYKSKFYLGCILSGILGAFLNLSRLHLKSTSPEYLPAAIAASKTLLIFLSTFIFEVVFTSDFAFSLLVGVICHLVFLSLHPDDDVTEKEEESTPLKSPVDIL